MTYIQCPYCLEKYIICFNTHDTVVMSKKIKQMIQELSTIKNPKQYARKLRTIKKKQKLLEKTMEELEMKYTKYFKLVEERE